MSNSKERSAEASFEDFLSKLKQTLQNPDSEEIIENQSKVEQKESLKTVK